MRASSAAQLPQVLGARRARFDVGPGRGVEVLRIGAGQPAELQAVHGHSVSPSAVAPSARRSLCRARNRRVQNGRLREAELVGDFLSREPHQHLQHQRLAVVVLQGKDGAAYVHRLLVRSGGKLGGLAFQQLVDRHRVVPLALVKARVLRRTMVSSHGWQRRSP